MSVADVVKVTVLLSSAEFRRLAAYCEKKGFKKSTLIARLVRDHLDDEGFAEPAEVEAPGGRRPMVRSS